MKRHKRIRKTGLPPGSIVHTGERKVDTAMMTLIQFSSDALSTTALTAVPESDTLREPDSVSWLNVIGLHDTALLDGIGRNFSIHSLILEDIANTDQRPKVDLDENHLFLVTKMIRPGKDDATQPDIEQVSFVLGAHYLLTFQEKEGDAFEPVRERIRQNKGRLRRCGSDYLAYSLLDTLVDNYFVVLDQLTSEIDQLEEEVLEKTDSTITHRIHRIKSTLLLMRKITWPLREMVASLIREESALIQPATIPFLRDLYDHIIHVGDTIETQREMLSSLLEIHFSNVNKNMSDVMKVLTIIATVFIPLTFVVGIYGMNFEYMPELEWRWGYPGVMLFMFLTAAGMIGYFRFKRWL